MDEVVVPPEDSERESLAPHSWLEKRTEGRPRLVDPNVLEFVPERWTLEGCLERCRAVLASFPRPQLPFVTVPELNSSLEEGTITAPGWALKKGQDSLTAAFGPLVSLLEEGLEQDVIGWATVAAHVGPTIAHLGLQLAALTRERRECAITRIVSELRQLVAKDGKDAHGYRDKRKPQIVPIPLAPVRQYINVRAAFRALRAKQGCVTLNMDSQDSHIYLAFTSKRTRSSHLQGFGSRSTSIAETLATASGSEGTTFKLIDARYPQTVK
ncbi:hypothetical protein HPB47_022934 [Ixodes persulcatus]|uniref:Uncharacterized protein n=1 Tax=Ixodes persulcatus TaxID=34615 RepID=A0AC60Q976_IXOPE|nr:hypothetical protein HPB47_022934 [Ixodes persulcatus]